MDALPRHDLIIVMGDVNAKIGVQKDGEGRIVGKHVLKDIRNNNGERFVEFCRRNDMAITSTMYPHPEIYKYTWTSPDQRTRNQIDHLAVCGKFRRSIINTRCYRGADIGSDHNLGVGTLCLKLCKVMPQVKTANLKHQN